MKAIDTLLLNILVLIVPILLYHILMTDHPRPNQQRWNHMLVISICSVAEIFCMSHPIFFQAETVYDLRIIPILVAFLYSGISSGLLVSAVTVAYRFVEGQHDLIWILTLVVLLIPFTLTFISLSNWKRLAPKVMFPSLLAMISALTIVCVHWIVNMRLEKSINARFWIYGVVFCVIHMAIMWILTYLIKKLSENITMRRELQRSEKLNVLSELAASVAHEIRNPMTVARGFMQILNQPHINEEKKQVYTTMVIEEIDRAQAIISDYLAFAKPQADKLENLDVSCLTQKLINLITPYASLRNVEISIQMEPELWIHANFEKMIQCLVNLTKNGIEAMPNGGMLEITGFKRNQSIVLQIKDSGVGMTEEQMERLGTPFYSTKNKGTGLGMMVSYRIVKNFGGDISVQSQLGKGTCFTLILPVL